MHAFRSLPLAITALVGAVLTAMPQPASAQLASSELMLRRFEAPIQMSAPRLAPLIEKARGAGRIRVIAKVAAPAGTPAGDVAPAEISRITNEMVGRVSGLGATLAAPIEGLPLSVLEVTPAQLQQLVEAGLVSDVVEDVADPPTLQDSIPLIHADTAATLGADGHGQTVAILDTGVAAAHPFFGGRVVSEACFSSNSAASGAATVCPGGVTNSTAAGSGAPCANAGCNHGTHVAGIAAGRDANRRGTAPQASIIAIQVFSLFTDVPGGAQSCSNANVSSPCILAFTSDQIRGLQRVFDLRNNFSIAAANMSLGGGNFTTCDTDTRKPLIDQLRGARIATVIASGNGSLTNGVGAPGCITTAITVGNTTKADAIAGSSNSAAVVDLLAPGTSITSSVPGGGFASMSGTSMATPHVTGAIAALRSVRNDLTVDQAEQALESTGVSITDTRNNIAKPRINLEAAVRSVLTTVWTGAIWHYTNTPCTGESCPGWAKLDNNTRTVSVAAGDNLYQLHGDGTIWRSTGQACNGDSCPGWVRLDNNPMGVAIAAGGSRLYQLHRNGAIWQHTGQACAGESCPGWVRLDNNPLAAAIVADGDKLYQLHRSGAIWEYTGQACNGESCPGWRRLDNNPMGAAIVAGNSKLYQLHRNGAIWEYTGQACNGESCPGWRRLDNNPMGVAIVAGGAGLFQLHRNGAIWEYTGQACNGESCPGWRRLDNNPAGIAIAAGAKLYQLHRTGMVWEYTGQACNGESCPGWRRLDNNPRTRKIAAAGNDLYQMHASAVAQKHQDGRIWQSMGTACSGQSCPGWQLLDNNTRTAQIASGDGYLYQLHNDGRIWRSTGAPCQGESCPGWQMLDNNPRSKLIATAKGQLYQMHQDGKIWRATGAACQGQSCPGWQLLDNNPATRAIAAGGDQLYQLHADGKIWRSTGGACQGQSCPGWQMLDNNARTRAIAAGGNQLYQMHQDGRIWRSTGAPCQGQSCPGWQMLDNNARSRAIAADEGQLYQMHVDGKIWRATGAACQGQSCPGWQMLDNNPRGTLIDAGGGELFQMHNDGRIWRSLGTPCQNQSCPGWQMLDNNQRTRAISASRGK